MRIQIIKKGASKKPAGYCEVMIDEPPMNKK
jgi:hypothetical protein